MLRIRLRGQENSVVSSQFSAEQLGG